MSVGPDGRDMLHFESQSDLETWLEANHDSSDGIWLMLAKKGSSRSSVSYDEAVELGLCFGWIDGQARKLDDDFWLQRFTPRRKRSIWSQINRDKATELIRQGRIRPAGLAAIEAAKADGRWDRAYASSKNLTIPDDLRAQLDAHPDARAHFESLSATNRFAIVYRIESARRPETRTRRIEKYLQMLLNGEKLY